MTRCPECNHENILNLPICEHCYAFLSEQPLNGTKTSKLTSSDLDYAAGQLVEPHQHGQRLASGAIAVYVERVEKPMIMQLGNELILGRTENGSEAASRLDLAAYGGLEAGVSRLHAVIRRVSEVEIMDLGSTNGTWLNDDRLTPYVSKPLHSGDQVRLGRLWVTVYF